MRTGRIVFGAHYGVPIAAACKTLYDPEIDRCLATVDGETIRGGFIFREYTGPGGSIQVHMAGFLPKWVSRDLLFNVGNYVFNHCQCRKLFGQVPEHNTKALAMNLKLGLKKEFFLEGVFPDGGCHVLSMTKEECSWLKPPLKGVTNG